MFFLELSCFFHDPADVDNLRSVSSAFSKTRNNAINEVKNTLEGTNSRITKAEDRISEIEDRMVEINETERKKNELKEMRTISETTGKMLNASTFKS